MRLGLFLPLIVWLVLGQEPVFRTPQQDLILDLPTDRLLPRYETIGENDEKVLQEAGIAPDGPALLDFLRKRSLGASGPERIQALIRQLGDHSFKVRTQASKDLVLLGPAAAPFLREATHVKDLEVARRAEECLRLIG